MNDHQFEMLFKILFIFLVIAIFAFIPWLFGSESDAAYSTNASSSSTLTVVVLPALEHTVLGAELIDSDSTAFLLGLRSNTAWGIDYTVENSGSTASSCSTSGADGQRNYDNSFQELLISCDTAWSWADQEVTQTLTYTITPLLRGEN
jgi:hypothetical protein